VALREPILGSIGVVSQRNLHGLFYKLGVTEDSLQARSLRRLDSEYQPLPGGAVQKLLERGLCLLP